MNRVVWVGASDMREIGKYIGKYKSGLFIEARPDAYRNLVRNLRLCNEHHGTRFKAVQALVSNDYKQHTFYLFNNGDTSSMYPANPECWPEVWKNIRVVDTIELQACKLSDLLIQHSWDFIRHDLVVDVQGAELKVLRSMGDFLENVEELRVEMSVVDFHQGGVTYKDLHAWLHSRGFERISELRCKWTNDRQGDVIYKRSRKG